MSRLHGEITLMHTHNPAIGYGILGVNLADQLATTRGAEFTLTKLVAELDERAAAIVPEVVKLLLEGQRS